MFLSVRKISLARLLMSCFLISLGVGSSEWAVADAKIYVIREADGALRFTNKAPLKGQDAAVFSAAGRYYRTATPSRLPSGEIIYGRARASLRVPRSPVYSIRGFDGRRFARLYSKEISANSERFGVDASLVRAVIHAESGFNRFAVSPKGAQGLMQLMPSTARELGVSNSFDPRENIRGGVKYLAQLLERLGDEALAVAAYNAGETPVRKYKGIPPYSETRAYVRRVLSLKKQYSLNGYG